MNQQTFIFIGRSGCGKGAQVKLLKEYLEKNDTRPVVYVETGNEFRAFIKGDGYSSVLAKEIMEKGARQPDFLAINLWGKIFMNTLTGNEHVIGDGFPRSLTEAQILDTAIKFYKRPKPIVIYVNVSVETVVKRMMGRGRADDNENAIRERLAFFERDVMPAVDFFRSSSDYTFLDVDGEPTIQEIHDKLLLQLQKIWQSQ